MKRIDFIKNSTLAGAAIATSSFPTELFAKSNTRRITILHTNDQHSRIESFPVDGGKYQGLGGFAQRAALIKEIRKQEKNVLLLDSGDIWQGTPYFNKYGGELEFKLMTEMKYDASTLGNHDFDAGIDGFLKQLPHAGFQFLNSNYDFSNSGLKGKIQEYKIFTFDEIKIGVFGLGIELAGLVPKDLCEGVQYNDPINNAQRVAAQLKHDFKCDYVVCLSHLGYKYEDKKVSDVVLAESTKNIDLILGGHTHTFFDKPEVFRNAEQKKVLVNQVGWAGLYIGRIDLIFEKENKNIIASDKPILVEKG